MSKKFYIADTHFGHKNIIRYDNRPFYDIDEMERAMTELWNETVTDKDEVYILGDVVWPTDPEKWIQILDKLNGIKYIVKGNHDDEKTLDALMKHGGSKLGYDWCYMDVVKDNGRHVVLSHTPQPFFPNAFKDGWYHLHGHVHAAWDWNMIENFKREIESLYERKVRMYNVGCMLPYMNYTPRTLDEIIEGYEKYAGSLVDFVRGKKKVETK